MYVVILYGSAVFLLSFPRCGSACCIDGYIKNTIYSNAQQVKGKKGKVIPIQAMEALRVARG
jgi:hypothetical protein